MHFTVTTRVKQDYKTVFAGFDHDLLLKLNPPGIRLQFISADPPDKADGRIRFRVTLFGLIRQEWENVFSDYEVSDAECHFVDEGRKMPFPFTYWRHDHRVLRDGAHTRIVDDVRFRTRNFLLDGLLFPVLWLQFRYRRPLYRRYFGRP